MKRILLSTVVVALVMITSLTTMKVAAVNYDKDDCDVYYELKIWYAPNPEYCFINTTHTFIKGDLLRSTDYDYPSGSMSIAEALSVEVEASLGLKVKVIEAGLKVTVGKTTTFTDTQDIVVPYGMTDTIDSYEKLQRRTAKVYEDDVWYDDYLGTMKVTKPVGVIFETTVS